MMSQTELVRYKEVNVCKEQLTLTPTEWDANLSVQERLAVEDVAKRKLYLPIFVYVPKSGEHIIFYGNSFYKAYRDLCGKYDEVKAVIFEFNNPIDAVMQFVAWKRLVLRANVKRSELRALMNILRLDVDEGQLREMLGPLSAFIELPPPRREPELPREAQPQVPPPPPPPSPQAPTPPPPSLEEVLKIREAVHIAEKIERLGERGKQIVEKLDEKRAEKLAQLMSSEQKFDLLSEVAKMPEDVLKRIIMLSNSPHFANIITHLDALYEELADVDAILAVLAKKPDVVKPVAELLKSASGIKLLTELLRFKEAWADLAYSLSKIKSVDELIERL